MYLRIYTGSSRESWAKIHDTQFWASHLPFDLTALWSICSIDVLDKIQCERNILPVRNIWSPLEEMSAKILYSFNKVFSLNMLFLLLGKVIFLYTTFWAPTFSRLRSNAISSPKLPLTESLAVRGFLYWKTVLWLCLAKEYAFLSLRYCILWQFG